MNLWRSLPRWQIQNLDSIILFYVTFEYHMQCCGAAAVMMMMMMITIVYCLCYAAPTLIFLIVKVHNGNECMMLEKRKGVGCGNQYTTDTLLTFLFCFVLFWLDNRQDNNIERINNDNRSSTESIL